MKPHRTGKNIVVSFLSVLLSLTLLFPVQAASLDQYEDLYEEWYQPYISQALDLGLMSGLNETTFGPDENMNRAMAAVVLYRMSGSPQWYTSAGFSDVVPDDYFYDAVNFCKENGILSGYEDGRFGPLDLITRQDLVKMIYGWASLYRQNSLVETEALVDFADADQIADYAYPAVIWAISNQIMSGSDNLIAPQDLCTRAQAAKLFSQTTLLEQSQTEPDPEFPLEEEPTEPEEPAEESDPSEEMEWPQDELLDQEEQPESEDDDLDPGLTDEEPQEEAEEPDLVLPGKADDKSLVRNVKMYGIDISEHNGDMDLTPYIGQFVIIRAGYWTKEDRWFKENVRKCEQLGIPYGIYWYSYALDSQQAMEEARACLKTIQGAHPALGVWYDMEDADHWKRDHDWTIDHKTIGTICRTFCKELYKSGYYTGIYTSITWQKFLEGYCDPYPRWIAHWGNNNGNIHYDYSSQGVLHQYTSRPQDKNVLYVNLDAMKWPFSY